MLPDLDLRAEFRDNRRWLLLLASFPLLYIGLIVAPPPFGLGYDFGNDFADHRIWWVQMDAFWIAHGQVPVWNPVDQFGVLHFGSRGMAWFYPFRWWLYFPAIWAPSLNYAAHYAQVIMHMAVGLWGVFFILRRHTKASAAAAAVATTPFILNQRFTDFVRYPQGVEAMSWIPWVLLAMLECTREDASAEARRRWGWRLALATALTLLAGYGQLSYIGALLCAVVLLCTARTWNGLLMAGGNAALGILAAVGSIYPIVYQSRLMDGRRGGDVAWADLFPPPRYLDMWLRPFAAELHGSAFFPPIFLSLCGLGIVVALTSQARRLGAGMLAALLLIGDLSRGSAGFSFNWFYDHAPMFHAFRIQGRNFWPALIVVAFFSAHGLAWLEAKKPRALLHLGFMAVLTAAMLVIAWRAGGPLVLPDRVPGYSALSNQWITEVEARWAYSALLVGGIICLGLLSHRPTPRRSAVAGILLIALFVLAHARFNTWLATQPLPSALTSVRAAYPHGVLQPYQQEAHQGILAVWGADETTRNKFDSYVRLQPRPAATFPASRFCFFPSDPTHTARVSLQMLHFGANHVDFEVQTEGPGRLVYFASIDPRWSCNIAIHPWPESERLFMAFEMPAGLTRVSLRFTPWSVLAAGAVSLCAMALLVIRALPLQMLSRPAIAIMALTAAAVILFLAGALGRRDLDATTLFGHSSDHVSGWMEIPTKRPGD